MERFPTDRWHRSSGQKPRVAIALIAERIPAFNGEHAPLWRMTDQASSIFFLVSGGWVTSHQSERIQTPHSFIEVVGGG